MISVGSISKVQNKSLLLREQDQKEYKECMTYFNRIEVDEADKNLFSNNHLLEAEKLHADAMNYLKENYDLEKAIPLIRSASDLGYSDSQWLLGDLHTKGIGVEKNFEKAVHYFQLSRAQNNPNAFAKLGRCYELGIGVPKDPIFAKELFKKGSKLGSVECTEHLANLYLENKDDDKIASIGFHLLRKAFEQDENPDYLIKIADCYENGIGVKKSDEEAHRFIEYAVERGSDSAKIKLSWCYINGKLGFKEDTKLATKFLTDLIDEIEERSEVDSQNWCYDDDKENYILANTYLARIYPDDALKYLGRIYKIADDNLKINLNTAINVYSVEG